jgi:hypothetical protein
MGPLLEDSIDERLEQEVILDSGINNSGNDIEPYVPKPGEIIKEQVKHAGKAGFSYALIAGEFAMYTMVAIHVIPSFSRWVKSPSEESPAVSKPAENPCTLEDHVLPFAGVSIGLGLTVGYMLGLSDILRQYELTQWLVIAPVVASNLLDLSYERIRVGYLAAKERLIEKQKCLGE